MAARVGMAGLALAILLSSAPASAEVLRTTDHGFVVREIAEVTATPAEAWKALVAPAGWWLDEHTFSGSAKNLSLDPVAGGCFCEVLPVPKDAPKGQRPGGVEHMRVIYVEPDKALRLTGALGPLQSEAVVGTLTITLRPTPKGTRVLWEYIVGGTMRYKIDTISKAVDNVLAAQVASLAKKLGPVEETAPDKVEQDKPSASTGDEKRR